jgi:hypothetical protein
MQTMLDHLLLHGHIPLFTDEAHYHGWSTVHSREHSSTHSYLQRLANFKTTLAKVLSHNNKAASGAADAPRHTLKVNHFADWSREEFDRVMLPKKWKREHGILEPQVGFACASAKTQPLSNILVFCFHACLLACCSSITCNQRVL